MVDGGEPRHCGGNKPLRRADPRKSWYPSWITPGAAAPFLGKRKDPLDRAIPGWGLANEYEVAHGWCRSVRPP